MKILLVGGAVRDELLGLPVTERDWVVIGATEKEMLAQGFTRVGKDFPVFLHPQTKEEYALARKERKVGAGYHGFTFETGPIVTLEEDLMRRDLTINAMAKTAEGQIIDPFGGQKDCQKRLLRHVSEAFVEDPVRVLRVARFAARFNHLGFSIAPQTLDLMRQIAQDGELDHLVAERVFKEMQQAFKEPQPFIFFKVLQESGALTILFPEIANHYSAVQNLSEGLGALSPLLRFATMLSSLEVKELDAFSARYPLPNDLMGLAKLIVTHFGDFEKAQTVEPEPYLKLLEVSDAFRRQDRFEAFLEVCEFLFAKRFPDKKSPSLKLKQALQVAKAIDIQSLIQQGHQGEGLKKAIHSARLKAIANILFPL